MNNRSRLALMVVQILVISLMVALFGRLFYLQVAAGPKYKDAALSIQSRDVVSPANRGFIVDGFGVPLAMNKAGLAITIDRIAIDKLEDKGVAVMKRLSTLLKLKYSDVYQNTRLCGELPVGKRAGCWQGSRYQPIPITKSADPEIALQIVERSDEFPGVDAQPVAIRSYPSYLDVNAAHVLGYVGPLTESDLLKGNGKQYYRSESIGKTGLEIEYDTFLRGEPGIRTVIVDRKESITRESQNTQPTPGNHLVTSLDVRLQASAEKALKDAVLRGRANGYTSDSGAAVVMDIRTGRVLALASYPTYDPNAWEKGLTVQQAEDLFSEKKSVPALNRALQGLFAPASTFKVVSLLAAATAGYDLKANYKCPSEVQVGTRTFRNFDSKNQGTMNMFKAMAVSCDTIWYQIAFDEWLRDGGLRPKSNPNDHFFEAAKAFNITQRVGIDLPSESSSRLADREYKENWYQQNKDFYCNYKERASKAQQTPFLLQLAAENCVDGDKIRAGDAVNFSIGQGDTVVTPLKLTQMYAAIANGGTIWQMMVAKAIVKTDGTVVQSFTPKKLGNVKAAPSVLSFLRGSLREVVVNGTATGTFAGFPVEISGKTGTAQVFGRNPNGSLKDDTSWFASYAPSKKPRYAVVMMVGQGGFGASTSGVGVRQIYSTLFGVTGNTLVPGAALFPDGKPPTQLPKISPATKPKEASK
ncbi:MAG: cell division protein FtsI [Actinobacteria bacterium BACL15 MAG-120619-bin91]|jgi:penicillin-binding protein 2|uniref:Cell division protein FtsI n=1 Tax=Actinobacteria bacterium BACL15 MAG-120619-bin91 TaxID=1655562 RepID=A0A0R2PDA6_9ACTN|nr:MAG: cell division protein FtsI [Actinobacteria bacterium BACL15 MAG-120619-bin91]